MFHYRRYLSGCARHWEAGVSLVTGHVLVVALVAVCATILGMAHVLHGSDPTNIYIACIASFSAHGVTSTLKGGT